MSRKKSLLVCHYDSKNFNPPAPVLTVTLSAPVSYPMPTIKCPGLIDSGADITVIPRSIARQLKLKYVDEIAVMGYDGTPGKAFVYSAKIILGNLGTLIIRTIASEIDYALIVLPH